MPAEQQPSTLHIISHTHWDREWYRSFQQFRLKLVHLVDNLLTILDNDPDYLYFMLDGQTIVLEDYLQMRMEKLPLLQKYIHDKRILIGPWYILPDEYLVSPEATIRNLLIGKEICALFDSRMMVGYIPDPFGHISQMPQILNGFRMDTACLWRGVPAGSPLVLNWQAPDGSTVLLAHLYYGYGDIADWPKPDLDESVRKLDQAVERLAPYNPTNQYLLMRGTDHLEPRPATPKAIAYYNQKRGTDRHAIHSTLPAYLAAVSAEAAGLENELKTLRGELRDPQKAHMLPAVLSARMWIKQRNWYSQNLLERWAEPFSTWAELTARGKQAFSPIEVHQKSERLADPGAIIHQAWKLLIANHPHDSICGCSIDETHNDMVSRFDQVDQIGEEITRQSLDSMVEAIDHLAAAPAGAYAAITVFNAAPVAQSDALTIEVELPAKQIVKLVDAEGNEVPCVWGEARRQFKESNTFPFAELGELLASAASEGRDSQQMVAAYVTEEDGMPTVEAQFSSIIKPDEEALGAAMFQIMELSSRLKPSDLLRAKVFSVAKAELRFSALNVPALGYKTYYLVNQATSLEANETELVSSSIENQWFKLELAGEDGSLNLLDKRNGERYLGLNQFIDVGDRGDEYNFTPPENDRAILPELLYVESFDSPVESSLVMHCVMDLPLSLTEARDSRQEETVECPLELVVTMSKAIPAIDFVARFENNAMDHRLEVRFPSGLKLEKARYDGHFDVLERDIDPPAADANWSELPRPEVPQRDFADLSDGQRGLMLANQGLPEVAALRDDQGKAVLALTLLRCVGWLSRDDLWNRKGHAGPPLETPGAQEQGLHEFSYRLIPHLGDWRAAVVLARGFQMPLEAKLSGLNSGSLAPSASLVEADHPAFLLSTVKEAEDGSGAIVRGYNQEGSEIELSLRYNGLYSKVFSVFLDESLAEELRPEADGSLKLKLGAHKILSLLFRLEDLD